MWTPVTHQTPAAICRQTRTPQWRMEHDFNPEITLSNKYNRIRLLAYVCNKIGRSQHKFCLKITFCRVLRRLWIFANQFYSSNDRRLLVWISRQKNRLLRCRFFGLPVPSSPSSPSSDPPSSEPEPPSPDDNITDDTSTTSPMTRQRHPKTFHFVHIFSCWS